MVQSENENQSGFTIVELVVVIIIIGDTGATALPRFIDVQDEAQVSVAEGVRGAFEAGIGLAKLNTSEEKRARRWIWMADGTNDVVVNSNGYAVDDGRPVVVSTSALVYLLVSWAPGTGDHYSGRCSYHRSQCLDGSRRALAAGTDWYAVDNNATLATCDFIYLPEGVATGAFSRQFVYSRYRPVGVLATSNAP